MGKSQRDKGARVERNMIELLKDLGISSQRTAGSGALYGHGQALPDVALTLRDDLQCWYNGWRFTAEVKARAKADGWKTIKDWMGASDTLLLVEDRKKPLVVLSWESFTRLTSMIKNGENNAPLTGPEL